MDYQRSLSNPNLFNNTVSPGQLIKFPTITKLIYDGDNSQTNSKAIFKSTNTKLYNKTSFNLSTSIAQTHSNTFRVVQVPPQNYIMKICVMNINQPSAKNKSPEKQSNQQQPNSPTKKQLLKQTSKQLYTSLNFHRINKTTNSQKLGQTNLQSQSTTVTKIRKRSESLVKLKFNFNIPDSKINVSQFYFQVIAALALYNGQVIINHSRSFQRIRRAKVEKGNNGYLVKQTIKKRCWWNTTQQTSQANLIWTEKSVKNIQANKQKQIFYYQIKDQQQSNKIIFQRNIDQALLYYPKILQLFFTEPEIHELTKSNLTTKSRRSYTIYNLLSNKKATRKILPQNTTIYNHIPNHHEITSKKMLYKNLWRYYHQNRKDPYQYIPKTYHLTAFDWQEKIQFVRSQEKKNPTKPPKNIPQAWFLKPGQNSNRGKGIQLFKTTNQVLDYIMRNPPKTINKTYILQQYINPLLYNNRKFDIRCYLLCIQVFNTQTFYWYEEGYIRTSSTKFTMSKTSISIHLTNDAVQKQFNNYDKYQSANKLSYIQLDKYIKNQFGYDFLGEIVPKMKEISTDICKSAIDMGYNKFQNQHIQSQQQQQSQPKQQHITAQSKAKQKKQQANPPYQGLYFQLFGLDFIISKQGNPFLLEVNTNPCLEIGSNLLSRIIPDVVENTFRIVTDVYMPHKSNSNNSNANGGSNGNNAGGINNNINSSGNGFNVGNVCPDWAQTFIINNRFSLLYRRQLAHTEPSQKQKQQSAQKNQKLSTSLPKSSQIQQTSQPILVKQKQKQKNSKSNPKYEKQTTKNSFFKFGSNFLSKYRYTPQMSKY